MQEIITFTQDELVQMLEGGEVVRVHDEYAFRMHGEYIYKMEEKDDSNQV